MGEFIVRLRNTATRSWGNQIDVTAPTALEAAQQAAGEPLQSEQRGRDALRARVWEKPYDTKPDEWFYHTRAEE